jgi:hypothetical protein
VDRQTPPPGQPEPPPGSPQPPPGSSGSTTRPSGSDSRNAEEVPGSVEIPLGQRLCERPFLLLIVGILIMAVFYTGWGLYEIASLTPAPLP